MSIEKAMDIFYNSPMLPLLEDGVADLHCRSDKYLAEEIWMDTQICGLDRDLKDVDGGRVYHADSVDDMFKQILGDS